MRLRNSSGTPIVNGSGQACFSSIAQIGAGGSYNFYGTLELVRISGPILNGSVMNNAAWAFGVYNTNGLLNDDSIDASQIYPAGAITLKSIACTPTFPAVVQLPTINQGALSAGSAGATAFAIGLRCDTGAQVGISLDAAAGLSVIDANNGILSVQTGGGGAWACRSSTNARFLCACSRASIWARSAPMCRTAFPLWRATFGSGP